MMNMLGDTLTPFNSNYDIGGADQLSITESLISKILEQLNLWVNGRQLLILDNTLHRVFDEYEIIPSDNVKEYAETNEELLNIYLEIKRLEGLSERSLQAYMGTFNLFLEFVNKDISDITTQDVRDYLLMKKKSGACSNTSLDNIRRNLNTVFTWFCDEGYVLANPCRNIAKIRSKKKIKKGFTNKEIIKLRDHILALPDDTAHARRIKARDLAIFELLLASGIRVGEMVKLNSKDIDFTSKSFIVKGKGGKERIVYFNDLAATRLNEYLDTRTDDNESLFVGKNGDRFQINGVEQRLRLLGREIDVQVHPHKFRRTFATNLLRKGATLEQVSTMLGHRNIETTTIYAITDDDEVKFNHNRLTD